MIVSKFLYWCTWPLAWLCLSLPIRAQSANPATQIHLDNKTKEEDVNLQQGEIPTLAEVTITAPGRERADFEVSEAMRTVEHASILKESPTTLPEILRGETGTFIQQTTPGQGAPIIRGLLGSSIVMIVDGMRLNSAIFRPSPNQYFALVDPYNIAHLKIIRGASPTLYGSDALGGVISVSTPVPRFDTEQWQLHGQTMGRFGSADLSRITRLAVKGGTKGFAMSSGFTYQGIDDLRGGGNIGIQRPSGYRNVCGRQQIVLQKGTSQFPSEFSIFTTT